MSGRRECWRSGCARSIRRSPLFIPMYIYPSSVQQIGEETLMFSLKVVSRRIVQFPSYPEFQFVTPGNPKRIVLVVYVGDIICA